MLVSSGTSQQWPFFIWPIFLFQINFRSGFRYKIIKWSKERSIFPSCELFEKYLNFPDINQLKFWTFFLTYTDFREWKNFSHALILKLISWATFLLLMVCENIQKDTRYSSEKSDINFAKNITIFFQSDFGFRHFFSALINHVRYFLTIRKILHCEINGQFGELRSNNKIHLGFGVIWWDQSSFPIPRYLSTSSIFYIYM